MENKKKNNSHAFLELIASFDSDKIKRGTQFEKLCKWLLENHPLYKSKLKQVWLWDDWPGCWGKDCGIDIVAEDIDGKNWAIQAKCYDPKYSVTKKDIDSFLSESTNTKIHRRLLIATTDGIGSNALGVIQRQHETIPVNQLMLTDLLEAPIEWPESIRELSTATIKKAFEPKLYQQIAIDKIIKNLDSRGQLIMACGTGKTLTGLWIAENFKAEITLVLLPSLLLLSKTLTEWLTHSKESFAYLPVCSDDTVAKSEDTINLSTSDLSFPSTTDADEIATFITNPGRKVIFSTYQSSDRIAEACRRSKLSPIDLIIADEAHRCAGKADSAYSTVLDNEQIPASKRLFMTATPKIFQSSFKKRASDSDIEVVSMDDETSFGPVMYKLSFGEAIEQGLLTDYQVIVLGIDNPSYSAMITKRTLIKTDSDIQSDAQSFASHIGLAKAIKSYDLKRVISFHSRVSSARDFANKLPEVIDWMSNETKPDGDLLTNYVSGAMPTKDRNKNLQAMGNITDDQRFVLSNARCLSEGVDVPTLDGVAFIDPRNSKIDIVQTVGRAIRLSEGKSIGSIVIPVFIEDNEDPDEVLNSSPFKKVWAVVNALRSHDEALGDELDELRYSLGKKGSVGKSNKIIFDIPTTVTQDFQKALEIKLIESTTQAWEFWYGVFEDYVTVKGDSNVPQRQIWRKMPLGYWVSRQRTIKNILSPERLEKLNKLNFIWDVDEYNWQKGLKEFIEFKQKFGTAKMPNKHKNSDDFHVGNWQRVNRRNKDKLSEEKIQALDREGFIWDPKVTDLQKKMSEIRQFKKEHGDLLLLTPKLNKQLSKWAQHVRGGAIKLGEKEKDELNKLGFIWGDLNVTLWERGYKELLLFKEKEHHVNVPQTYISSTGFNLGYWVSEQRNSKDDTRYGKERTARLNAIGFIWNTIEEAWDFHLNELKLYKETNGDCFPGRGFKTSRGTNLGSWCTGQRSKKKKGSLTNDQIKRLNEIGFVWNQDNWTVVFGDLKRFKEKHGHCLPSREVKTSLGTNLGSWCSKQRVKKANGSLSKDKIERLDKIGFVWDTNLWDFHFNELKRYKKKYGNCSPPQGTRASNGSDLGVWCTDQRIKKKKDKLSADQTTCLDELGFIWDPVEELWNKSFLCLCRYVNEYQTVQLAESVVYEGITLGRWVAYQRSQKRKGKLAQEKINRLNEINFIWSA